MIWRAILRAKEDDMELREVRVPDAEGWWCRRYGGKLKWFRVEMVSDVGEPPFTPSVYVSDLEEMGSTHRSPGETSAGPKAPRLHPLLRPNYPAARVALMRATQALELLKMAKPESDREALLIIVATALDALGAPDLAWPLLREAAKTRKTL